MSLKIHHGRDAFVVTLEGSYDSMLAAAQKLVQELNVRIAEAQVVEEAIASGRDIVDALTAARLSKESAASGPHDNGDHAYADAAARSMKSPAEPIFVRPSD